MSPAHWFQRDETDVVIRAVAEEEECEGCCHLAAAEGRVINKCISVCTVKFPWKRHLAAFLHGYAASTFAHISKVIDILGQEGRLAVQFRSGELAPEAFADAGIHTRGGHS